MMPLEMKWFSSRRCWKLGVTPWPREGRRHRVRRRDPVRMWEYLGALNWVAGRCLLGARNVVGLKLAIR